VAAVSFLVLIILYIWNIMLTLNLAGYLILGRKCSDDIAKVVQDCIDSHIDQNLLGATGPQLTNSGFEGLSDQSALKSICLTINSRLHTCAYPPDSILTVVLGLFLKLGMSSFFSAVASLIFNWTIAEIF
jgi:hypothetical protein